jgi:hypothetical protein
MGLSVTDVPYLSDTGEEIFPDLKKACDSFRREAFYEILIELGLRVK